MRRAVRIKEIPALFRPEAVHVRIIGFHVRLTPTRNADYHKFFASRSLDKSVNFINLYCYLMAYP
jgi:hypothetical protein